MTNLPALLPRRTRLEGRYVLLRPLEKTDAAGLWESGADEAELWRWMSNGPFESLQAFESYLEIQEASDDPLFFAIVDRASSRVVGHASFLRIEPKHRVIEVGHILYTRALKKTRAATEAMYLLARYVFEDLQYRRYEWKCNALNAPSRAAALRLGFQFEGIFRQHMIIKGQNRDTAWFAMLDSEWPERKACFERWLDPANFDEQGVQKQPL